MPSTGQITFTGNFAQIGGALNLVPGTGALTLTGTASTTATTITPTQGAITLTGAAPVLTSANVDVPTQGTVALQGYPPTLSAAGSLVTQSGALSLTGYAPTLTSQVTTTLNTGAVALTGTAPVLSAATTVTPALTTMTLTGFGPAVTQQRVQTTQLGTLTLTGAAPTVAIASQAVSITPAQGAVTLTGFAPTAGVAAPSATITPPSGALALGDMSPLWAATVLELHFNGSNNSTVFTDSSRYGTTQAVLASTAKISTLNEVDFTSPSGLFNGGAISSTANCAFGTSDFTVEMWISVGDPTSAGIFTTMASASGAGIILTNDGYFGVGNGASMDGIANAGSFIPANGNWYHIAFVRSGSNLYAYVDGSQVGSATTSRSLDQTLTRIGTKFTDSLTGNLLSTNIDDLRVTNAARYTGSTYTLPEYPYIDNLVGVAPIVTVSVNTVISVPTGSVALGGSADPYWSNVVLAMHLDGTNGSTTFTDLTGKTTSAVGAGAISTAASKFGGASLATAATAGARASPSIDFSFGGDFTIDGWFNFTSVPSAAYLFDVGGGFNLGVQYNFNTIGIERGALYGAVSWTPTVGQWYHIALERSGSTLYLYIDGLLVTSQAGFSSTLGSSIGYLSIGLTGSSSGVPGYVDDFRVTKGVARWTSTFEVPKVPFFDAAGMPPTVTLAGAIVPATGSIGLTGYAPFNSGNVTTIAPPSGSLAVTGSSSTTATKTTITTGSVGLTGFAPTLQIDKPAATQAGTLTLTGFAPTLIKGTVTAPATGNLTLTGISSLTATKTTPTTGSVGLTGNAPTLVRGAVAYTLTGSLTLTGYAGLTGTQLTPQQGLIALTGISSTTATKVTPSTGALTLTGRIPFFIEKSDKVELSWAYVVTSVPTVYILRTAADRHVLSVANDIFVDYANQVWYIKA
jgi:hypothetical protein